jgi:protein SCO1/2
VFTARTGRLLLVDFPIILSLVVMTSLSIGEPTVRAEKAPVTVGGPFTLTASNGTKVSDATYRGKWLLVFFGYTSCPDVCPTTLNEIAHALGVLGPAAAHLQPIFITVDPRRDTPDVMGRYTAAFDPRIVGLTGSPQQIAAVTHEYGAYSAPRKTGPGVHDYVVDHSTYIYIMDPNGKFVRGLDFGTPGDRIAKTLQKLMERSEKLGMRGSSFAETHKAIRKTWNARRALQKLMSRSEKLGKQEPEYKAGRLHEMRQGSPQ